MGFPSKRGQFREGSLDQYLKEISAYPLIDREEEVRLAKEIRGGAEGALNKLVRSNLRFVVSVAKKYQNQGVPLPDLINEGTWASFGPRTNSTRRRESSSSATRSGGFGKPFSRPWPSRAASFVFH
jgi:hypothetical protein